MHASPIRNFNRANVLCLLALKKERYGVEISQYIEKLTHGRVVLGPGTLYAILSKFEDEKWIQEKKSEGRKRSYIITNIGRTMLEKEYQHLLEMIEDTKQSEDDIYET